MNEFLPKSQSIIEKDEKNFLNKFIKFCLSAIFIVLIAILIVVSFLQLDEIYDFDFKKYI